jgi:hypothetical protein
MASVAIYHCFGECHYAECRYAECRGAPTFDALNAERVTQQDSQQDKRLVIKEGLMWRLKTQESTFKDFI